MASNGPMILCDNLVKIYKVQDLEVVALQGLDLVIERGEFMAIVGPSGSGKSSLLNILGGLDRPSAGKALVDNVDLLKASSMALTVYRREKIGFVWQQPSRNLIPYLSVRENVELPMIIAGTSSKERHAWSQELLETVGLWERRSHNLHQLSGGEQQRTAIAVGLANKPVLLLADEPTGEVDSLTAQSIMDTFRRLNSAYNLTIVVVTHNTQVSDQVDRVVAIRDGRTSTERVRRVQDVTPVAAVDENGEIDPEAVAEQVVTYHEYVVVDQAGRLQVPRDMLERMGITGRAELSIEEDHIRIKPAQALTTTTAQAAHTSEATDEWGSEPRSLDWKLRISVASRGLRGLFNSGRKKDDATADEIPQEEALASELVDEEPSASDPAAEGVVTAESAAKEAAAEETIEDWSRPSDEQEDGQESS